MPHHARERYPRHYEMSLALVDPDIADHKRRRGACHQDGLLLNLLSHRFQINFHRLPAQQMLQIGVLERREVKTSI